MKRLTRQLRSATPASREQSIVVTTPRGATVIAVREIDWLEAADNYARIWIGGRSYLLREALSHLEERVGAHGFVRAHRRALVRLGAVRELKRTADGFVAMLGCGVRIPVSRRQRSAFATAVRRLGLPRWDA
jgi:two-component system LytT family response regulator